LEAVITKEISNGPLTLNNSTGKKSSIIRHQGSTNSHTRRHSRRRTLRWKSGGPQTQQRKV
jgi:hypothetical protein